MRVNQKQWLQGWTHPSRIIKNYTLSAQTFKELLLVVGVQEHTGTQGLGRSDSFCILQVEHLEAQLKPPNSRAIKPPIFLACFVPWAHLQKPSERPFL